MPVRRARPDSLNEASSIETFFQQTGGFLAEHWWWILSLIILISTASFLLWKARQKYKQIEKLWVFILFFLTKRQMMIPLVISLSRKDKILDKNTQQKLLEIRGRCRDTSFKKSPVARLQLETEVSEILFNYFNQIEKKGQVKTGTKFHKIIQDLEFIDGKLVQLQALYNHEADSWNRQLRFPGIKSVLKPFGLAPFESFS